MNLYDMRTGLFVVKLRFLGKAGIRIMFGIFIEIWLADGYLAIAKQWNLWAFKFVGSGGGWD
jgi:hypothetical protein